MSALISVKHSSKAYFENRTFPVDEIAVRFHHKLVYIHPFPNGNGRHARFIADVLVSRLRRPVFTWGSASGLRPSLVQQGQVRRKYLEAVRVADTGELGPLVLFARS